MLLINPINITQPRTTMTTKTQYTYEYDTCGVLCRHKERDGDWEVLEPHCLNCGYPADDHDDEDCDWEDAPYIQDDTPAAERKWYKGVADLQHKDPHIDELNADDETNWNEEGDDELNAAIDASGNALY